MSVLMVPKAKFKPRAFDYLRQAARGRRICVTDRGRPVVDLSAHRPERDEDLESLRGLVLAYDAPTRPVDAKWEADA